MGFSEITTAPPEPPAIVAPKLARSSPPFASSVLWQLTHLLSRMGKTSSAKVTLAASSAAVRACRPVNRRAAMSVLVDFMNDEGAVRAYIRAGWHNLWRNVLKCSKFFKNIRCFLKIVSWNRIARMRMRDGSNWPPPVSVDTFYVKTSLECRVNSDLDLTSTKTKLL